MAGVRLSREAQSDFDDLIAYLRGVAGSVVAHRYGRQILTAISLLANFPDMGTARPELGTATRLIIVHPYLIFYERSGEKSEATVLRILHSARKVSEALLTK
ncbi:MAG TPA: type II toxin-antitoxin system RelE/ParE family toxin [Alphaproteobacteria bacterium]|nr:type II toxin-antitoxin system RelE/ParE family toxin [Alphaproteobacteria bacterium]